MLLMQEPRLLLLDEPVAGMSDEETERTAELFLTLAGTALAGRGRARHGVRRQDRAQGHRAARRRGARRRVAWRRSRRTAGDRGLPGPMSALTIDGLNQYYGGSHILRDLSFEVPAGKVTALLGRNGVGKTTLLQTLMGLVPPATGTRQVRRPGPHRRDAVPARARRASATCRRAARSSRASPWTRTSRWGSPRARAARGSRTRVFEMFPVLKQMLNRRGGDLSGGQQQQLAIGRALAMGPRLLILDEPTEGIQPSIIKDIERADPRARHHRRDGDPARRAVLRLRPLARRPVPGDGARRDRRARRRRGTWTRTACGGISPSRLARRIRGLPS